MAISAEVPGSYDCALDGIPFNLTFAPDDGGFQSGSVPLIRGQADQGARPGEQTLSPEDLWRRSVESWHHGAGQSRADREASDPYRFRTSLHLNPWERYELSKLNTLGFTAVGGGRARLVTVSNRLYMLDSNVIRYTSTLPANGVPTFTTVTGAPANKADMASDGYYVYSTHFADDIYRTDATTSVASSYITVGADILDIIRFVKGRLLVFDQAGKVYNPVTAGALPAAFFTHPLGSRFFWTDATEGTSFIYLSGVSGFGGSEERGFIYRTAVKADGTALDTPVIAGRMPDGEGVYAICGYLGLLFIGTSRGVRVAIEQSDGSLVIGALIETGMCQCFEPQGSQVWFGYEELNDFPPDTYAGLGRIDLSDYDGNGAPPYATDLMFVSGGGANVLTAATFNDRRVFMSILGADGVTENGLHCETTTPHDYGQLVSGLFNYGLTEPKTFHYLNVGASLERANVVAFVTDTSPYEVDEDATFDWYEGVSGTNLSLADHTHLLLGDDDPRSTYNDAIFDLGGRRSNELEYRLVVADTINRVTLQARPAVTARSERIRASLVVANVEDANGGDRARKVRQVVNQVRDMVRRGSPVEFQDGNETYPVIVEDYQFIRTHGDENEPAGDLNGILVVTMKRHATVTPVFRSVSTATTATASLSAGAPDGAQASDVLVAIVGWDDTGIAAPTVTGWTALGAAVGTAFKTRMYWKIGAADFDATFSGAVDAGVVVAAYSQGTTVDQYTAHTTTSAGDTPETYTLSASALTAPTAAVVGMVNRHDAANPMSVGAVRPRGRVEVTVGGDVLSVELGDAVSTSTVTDGGDKTDVVSHPVFYTGEARLLVAVLS